MTQSASDRVLDLIVSHQVQLQSLTTSTVRRVLAVVNRTETEVLAQLAATEDRIGRTRQESLLRTLRGIFRAGHSVINQRLEEDAGSLVEYEGEWSGRLLRSVLPAAVATDLPEPAQLRAAVLSRPFQGRLLREWGDDLESGAFSRVRDAVRIGFAEGASVSEVARRVRGTASARYRDGTTQQSRRGSESLVRTAMSHMANYSRELVYLQNPKAVRGVVWVSVLDSGTTPVCASRSGSVYPVGGGPRPPAHWNCRSTTSPMLASARQLGLDAADYEGLDGAEPSELTYGEWLSRRSAAEQDEILGPTRGRLFRLGGLSLGKFVDRAGRQLTIAQLRARDAEAFRKAGLT